MLSLEALALGSVVAGRIQREMSQLCSFVRDNAPVEVGDQDDYTLVSMGPSHADVVKLAAIAQRDRELVIDVVLTNSGLGERVLPIVIDIEGIMIIAVRNRKPHLAPSETMTGTSSREHCASGIRYSDVDY